MTRMLPILFLCLLAPAWLLGQTDTSAVQDEEIYMTVDVPPMFPGCEKEKDLEEQRACAPMKMLKYLYGRVKYPKEARSSKVQGDVVIKFVVEKDGSLSNWAIAKDIGGGCGDEILRVAQTMPNWHPGQHQGNPVRVQYVLPFKFRLE
jgi:TonB family protein